MPRVTAADILKEVPITRKTLWLWQKKYNFIPDPSKQVHPGGKGIVGYYPSWVKERCKKVFTLQKKGYTVAMIQEVLQKEAEEKSTHKILIVDDEKKFALLLKKFFIKNGYVVETAYNGLDAGLKASDFMPSIIVLDIALPGLNGIEVCRQLKSTPKTQNIHVIAITGNITYSEKSVLAAGADRFFKKPVNMARLLDDCNSLIDSPEFAGRVDSATVAPRSS